MLILCHCSGSNYSTLNSQTINSAHRLIYKRAFSNTSKFISSNYLQPSKKKKIYIEDKINREHTHQLLRCYKFKISHEFIHLLYIHVMMDFNHEELLLHF